MNVTYRILGSIVDELLSELYGTFLASSLCDVSVHLIVFKFNGASYLTERSSSFWIFGWLAVLSLVFSSVASGFLNQRAPSDYSFGPSSMTDVILTLKPILTRMVSK